MSRGLVRYHNTGNFHFITFSCFHRLPHLKTAAARDLFENALERTRLSYGFVVAGYVVMPEHVHLLIGEPLKDRIAGAIHALKLSVTLRRTERPFWQARYYDFNLRTSEKRTEKLRYMHRNPVKRGLVAKPEDWKWSSFLHYATGKESTVEIDSEWTARRRELKTRAESEQSCYPTLARLGLPEDGAPGNSLSKGFALRILHP